MKKKNIVIANWKMNPVSVLKVKEILSPIKRLSSKLKKTEVVIAPSFLHIPIAAKIIGKSKKIFLGAQTSYNKNSGAYTGEVSPEALKDLNVKYIIVGHSERRKMGESDGDINEKIKTILGNGLTPVVCIGEKERDREGKYLEFLKTQIKETLSGISVRDFMSILIAYEPIWAIGKSHRESLTGTDMHEMSLIIKKFLGEIFGEDYGRNARIIYGGSVEPENTAELILKGGVSGFLVGHASLEPDKFREILKITDSIK